MKEYELTEKKVRVNGIEYNAYFVKEHSNLQAIISECKDANAWDDYANIRDWRVQSFVLRKGSRKWENLYCGPKYECPENLRPDKGLYRILTELEDKPVKRKIFAKDELREAEEDLRDAQKRMKKAMKVLSLK